MHTNDPSGSDKRPRRDSDDVISEFRGGGVGGGGGRGGRDVRQWVGEWAMTSNWKAY